MYIEFMATLDDVVDTSYRFWQRGKRGSWGWITAIIITVALILLVLSPLGLLRPKDWAGFLIRLWPVLLCLFVALCSTLLSWLFYSSRLKDRLRGGLRRKLQITKPFLVQIELKPEGFWVKQMGCETIHDWTEIEGVEESDDSIDVLTRHAGMISVRKRAFVSDEKMDEFMDLVRSHIEGVVDQPQATDDRIEDAEKGTS